MKEAVIIEPYNEEWPVMFELMRNQIINEFGAVLIRIDHIGSTAIVGLASKPIIDIQMSVKDLNDIEEVKRGLCKLGFHYWQDNSDLTKKYFRETQGMRRTTFMLENQGVGQNNSIYCFGTF